MLNIPINDVAQVMRDCAATEIMPRFGKLLAHEIEEKSPNNLVTVADRAAEEFLRPRLEALLPGSVTIGEEAVHKKPSLIKLLKQDQPVWIIDPIDGTHNFAHGVPVFGIIIALIINNETQAGWIYDPNQDRMAMAIKGEGVTINGQPATVAAPSALADATGFVSAKFFPPAQRELLAKRAAALKNTGHLRCASHEYLALVEGARQFGVFRKLMVWDHAAGILMHAEAGGYNAKLDGSHYQPTDETGGILLAPDKQMWFQLRDHLFGEDVEL